MITILEKFCTELVMGGGGGGGGVKAITRTASAVNNLLQIHKVLLKLKMIQTNKKLFRNKIVL